MAKVTGPLFSISASGNIGKTLVYTSAKGVSIVKKLTPATDLKTEGQINQRELYSIIVDNWNDLSTGQKETWNEQSKGHPLTGFNVYMSHFLDLWKGYKEYAYYGVGKYGVNTYGAVM